MNDLALKLESNGGTLLLTQQVAGELSTQQQCIVNILCDPDKDIFGYTPSRGTALTYRVGKGNLFINAAISQTIGYAGLDTVFFVRTNNYAKEGDLTRIRDIQLSIRTATVDRVVLDSTFLYDSDAHSTTLFSFSPT